MEKVLEYGVAILDLPQSRLERPPEVLGLFSARRRAMREEVERAVDRMLAGERGEQSFEIIYDAWYARLQRYFGRKGVPFDTRDDLSQEHLVRLYRRLQRGGTIHNFDGYCWMIARNVFNRWLERKQSEETRYGDRISYMPETAEELDASASDEPWPVPISHPASPDASYLEKQLWEKLERLIDAHPGERTRECAWMSFIEGLSNTEIAAAMDIATGNVGYKLHQVRKRPEFIAFLTELRTFESSLEQEVGS